jgi:uncharacterized protein YqeY
MSTIIAAIRAASLDARRTASPLAGFYSAVLGALDTRAKATAGTVLSDTDAIAILQSFAKGVRETIDALVQRGQTGDALAKAEAERKAIEALLPKRMEADELSAYFQALQAGGVANMGQAMARLKADHFGSYDGKTASMVAKDVFAA